MTDALRPERSSRKTRWAWVAGTFFGAGLLKPGPGTWGSLAAAALWYAAARASQAPQPSSPRSSSAQSTATALHVATAAAALLITAVGVPSATRVARESGREDPGHVVIDEVAGQWVALIGCPPDAKHALLAFGLFRLFDITKPWPARQLESLPEGWGILLDDIAAGLYALGARSLLQSWR